MKNAGFLLIALGIVMMLVTGFNYVTRENVVDIGDLEIKGNVRHEVKWPPILGGVLLVAGTVVVLSRKKQ